LHEQIRPADEFTLILSGLDVEPVVVVLDLPA
jgi:hypothetical protein